MKTRIISLGYSSASLRQGVNLPTPARKAESLQTHVIDLDKPRSAASPRGRAGWVQVKDGEISGSRSSRFANRIPSASSAHGFSSSDITNGMRIFVDETEVTLSTSGSYTSKSDLLTQLATDMNTVNNVRAKWEVNGSRFHVEKTNNLPIRLAVGTSGSTTDQNQGLITLLNNGVSNIHHSRTPGSPVDTGRIQLESGWSENAVIINGVAIKHYYTDTFDGRIEAINDVSKETGVKATGQLAQVESQVTFGKGEGAENFSYKSVSINGVGITLKEFDPGDSVEEVVTDIVHKLGNHTRHDGALNYLDIYSEGTTVYLKALDLEHGIVVDGGDNADLYLVGKLGGRRFDGPSILLEQEGDEEIRVSMPSDPSSYTPDNEIQSQALEQSYLKSRDNLRRLLVHSPDTARLYLSHGLLSGSEPELHSGQARRIIHEQETLARGPGGLMEFKSTVALDKFRNRAAYKMAQNGYRFAKKDDEPQSSLKNMMERAERKREVFPLYEKMGRMDRGGDDKLETSPKMRGGLLDQYSLSGISKKIPTKD